MSAQKYLEELVAIESTRGKEGEVADYLDQILSKMGFSIEMTHTHGRRSMLATRGETSKLCFYGHMDTVPVYEGWNTDPFVLTKVDDRLYGLGSHDMKGGIASLLSAVELLPKSTSLTLLFCYDEEYDSDGAWEVAKSYGHWLKDVTHIISVEAGTAIGDISKVPQITLGRRGRARFIVSITGYSSHGGTNELGLSAISIAGRLISLLENAPMAVHTNLGTGSQYVASINSSAQGLSVPDMCHLEIERHFVNGEDLNSILSEYQSICDAELANIELTPAQKAQTKIEVSIKNRENPYMQPYVIKESDKLVKVVLSNMNRMFGECAFSYGRSVADDNIFANELSKKVVILGPLGEAEHSPNEWVSARMLQKYAELYKNIVLEYLNSISD